jgi:hypothetical protein
VGSWVTQGLKLPSGIYIRVIKAPYLPVRNMTINRFNSVDFQLGGFSTWWIFNLVDFQLGGFSTWWIFNLVDFQLGGFSTWCNFGEIHPWPTAWIGFQCQAHPFAVLYTPLCHIIQPFAALCTPWPRKKHQSPGHY